MGINLNKVLDWKAASAAETAMLEDLQGNILKGHGRPHAAHLFLNFGGKTAAPGAWNIIRSIGKQLPSAKQQLEDAEIFKEKGISGGRFLAFYLTAEGYRALGETATLGQLNDQGKAFDEGGLVRGRRDLKDPADADLDKHFRQEGEEGAIHGMLLIADDSEQLVENQADWWTSALKADDIAVLGVEIGLQHFNKDHNGIENFGYVDGRSQPLMLAQDIEAEEKALAEEDKKDGPGPHPLKWDFTFHLSQVLTPDPGGIPEVSHGSYFVFRKLEQNVKGFKDMESEASDSLADKIGLPALGTGGKEEKERERAGAMVVGRYENGTPFVKSKAPDRLSDPDRGPANNFDFTSPEDASGALCPFRSHIRKTNPRGESALKEGLIDPEELKVERSRIMARRGITYGRRVQDDKGEFLDRPSGGVGLLFMAYMSSIAEQFEVTQGFWANSPTFVDRGPAVSPATGVDPVIGQGINTPDQTWWPSGYHTGPAKQAQFDFGLFVHMKGGEYFFAPSKSFLSNLKEEPVIAQGDAIRST